MSLTDYDYVRPIARKHSHRYERKFCVECKIRRALFRRHGRSPVKADRQHRLCRQCFRSVRDRVRADRLRAIQLGREAV